MVKTEDTAMQPIKNKDKTLGIFNPFNNSTLPNNIQQS
tara:strand:+ start:1191 stop:1304 length:114 start_codon:yes stop_codon:yes gene_type:complete